jgi:KaiC/GvpD/RAD55 family RecA-like ATPase
MIAEIHNLNLSSADDFREILVIGAEIGGDLMLADEIRGGKRAVERGPRAPVPPPEPEPEREYPERAEVGKLWGSAKPCGSDTDVFGLLRSRAIDPDAATDLALARVLARGEPLPPWATYKGASWLDSGHRMFCRVVDSEGQVRSLRSWQVDGKSGPKRLPPSGCRASGLVLANREAAAMLAGKGKPSALVICEGEPDWLTWSTRVAKGVAVIGIGSGSWTLEHAAKIPKGLDVYIRTHCDPAGEKYAEHVVETIGEQCAVWRLTGTDGVDENDKAIAGTIPSDPAEGCEPANGSARKIQEERPRILTVQQLLSSSYARASNTEKPKTLTTGHWRVDEMTGGIRPGHTWVMGADTSWGKSSMAIAIADENIRSGHRVLIVSTEDDESIYGDRLMARRSRVRARDMRDRKLGREDLRKLADVLSKAEPIPVYLDGRGVTFERLTRQIEHVMVTENIDLVFLDYIQECRTKTKHDDDRRMFREIARLFRTVVKKHKRSGIILSQLTISDASKAPTKNEVRECKDMAHGAEVVALGWKPDRDINGKEGVLYEKGSRVLIVDKSKDGECGSVALDWDSSSACFNRVLQPDNHPPGFQDGIDELNASLDNANDDLSAGILGDD